ncbi:uncharacterized protein LOC142233214 [Haematobia irritans]|uniref:uncharacterized protein LOC142233214 n=1 Tax=Haematobia irritans TaxID=7368 RepID=UPI003F507741
MWTTMAQICRLCVNTCNDSKRLYDDNGRVTELHDIIYNYFHPRILNLRQWKNLNSICLLCWSRICDFHSFETSVSLAQLKLLDLDNCDGAGSLVSRIGEGVTSHVSRNLEMPPSHMRFRNVSTGLGMLPSHTIKEEPSFEDIDNEQTEIMPLFPQPEPLISFNESMPSFIGNVALNSSGIQSFSNSRDSIRSVNVPIHEAQYEFANIRNNLHEVQEPANRPIMVSDTSDEENSQDIKITAVMSLAQQTINKDKHIPKKELSLLEEQENSESYRDSRAGSEHNSQTDLHMVNVSENTFGHSSDRDGRKSCDSAATSVAASTDDRLAVQTMLSSESHHRSRKTQEISNFIIAQWKPMLSCDFCPNTFTTFSLFEEHFRLCHPKTLCHILCCDRKFVGAISIVAHARKHLSPKAVNCELCGKCFSHQSSLKGHMLAQHLHFKVPERKAIQRKRKIKKIGHVRWARKKKRKLVVASQLAAQSTDPLEGECERSANEDKELNASGPSNKKDDFDIDDLVAKWKPILKCELCKKSFKKFSSLTDHFRQSEERTCYIFCCSRKIYGQFLDKHARKHIYYSAYNCQYCDSCFTSKCNLERHVRRLHPNIDDAQQEQQQQHVSGPSIEAQPESMTMPSTTQSSKRKNIDKIIDKWKPILKCELCSEIYPKLSLMEDHFEQKHKPEKVFITCCSKKLTKRIQIERHALRHIALSKKGVKPVMHACELCSKTFHTRRGLLIHYNAIHYNRADEGGSQALAKYRCGLCRKVYRNSEALKKHTYFMHRMDLKMKIIGRKLIEKVRAKKQKLKNFSSEATSDSREADMSNNKTDESSITPELGEREKEGNSKAGTEGPGEDGCYKCHDCSKEFASKKGYLIHMTHIHLNAKGAETTNLPASMAIYKCNICGKKYGNLQSVSFHKMKVHKKELKIKIRNGKVICKRKQEPQVSDEHSEMWEDDDDVALSSKAQDQTSNGGNMTLVHDNTWKFLEDFDGLIAKWRSNLQCDLCSESYEKFSLLETHYLSKHPGESASISCCNQKLSYRPSIKNHVIYHLSSQSPVQCKYCSLSFNSQELLKDHIQETHIKDPSSANAKQKDHLQETPLKSNSSEKNAAYACPLCGKEFETSKGLTTHTTLMHSRQAEEGTKKYTCKLCGKVFRNLASLWRHKRLIHQAKRDLKLKIKKRSGPLSIDTAAQNKNDAALSTTPNISMGRKQWLESLDDLIGKLHPQIVCEICNESFTKFSLLQSHFQQTHTEEKFFIKCCNRAFSRRPLIRDHVMLHLDPNTFKCEVCGICFDTRDYLRLHLASRHPELGENSFYRCGICKKGFNTARGLHIHETNAHGNSKSPKEDGNLSSSSSTITATSSLNATAIHPNTYTPTTTSAAAAAATPISRRTCNICGKYYENPKSLYTHKYRAHKSVMASTIIARKRIKGGKKKSKNLSKKLKVDLIPLREDYNPDLTNGAMENTSYQDDNDEEVLPSTSSSPPMPYGTTSNADNVCKVCDKQCPTLKSLRFHIWYYHTKGSKHKCKICNKSFKRFHELRQHNTIHTGKYAYACLFCPKKFNFLSGVYSHRKTHHSDELSGEFYKKLM